MLAAVVERPGVLVVKDVPKPVLKPNQFLMKNLASSICNATDNHIVEGIFDGYHDFYPQILGHEICGEVVELGEDVTKVKIGDRITMYTPYGAFAEFVPAEDDYPFSFVPENISNEEASFAEMFDGAYRGTIAPAEIKPGEKVLITGCGPMGLTTVAGASLHGAQVIAIDFNKNRLDMAKTMGAKYVYNRSQMSTKEIIANIRQVVGEVDLAIMCIALDKSKELDAFDVPVQVLRDNGRMTGLNVEVKLEHHNHRMNPFLINRKNVHYQHNLERISTVEDTQYAVKMLGERKMTLEQMQTGCISLDELPYALDMCSNHLDKCIKYTVYPTLKNPEMLNKELTLNKRIV